MNEDIRNKWITSKINEIPTGLRILDAGAGELKYKPLCNHLHYVAQDFGQYDGKGNNAGLQMQSWDNSKIDIISDIINIPEPDDSFDAILCSEVFEHLPNPVLAIKEFSRLLKKKGTLIVTAPFCSLTHFAPFHFSTGFNRYFYERHLLDYGFEIIEIIPNGNFIEYLTQEVQRIPDIASRYCNKELSFWDRLKMRALIKTLSRLNTSDKGSGELLCFGYHVKAVKL